MGKNQFLKVKNSLLELIKDFMELKDRIKNQREVDYFLNRLLCL